MWRRRMEILGLTALVFVCVPGFPKEDSGLRVQLDRIGRIRVTYGERRVVNYDMLQLVDRRKGWRIVFAYGGSGAPLRRVSGAETVIVETAPNRLRYEKRAARVGNAVQWSVDYVTDKNAGATDCYYFVDIPMDALAGACFFYRTSDGREFYGRLPAGGAQTLATRVKKISFWTKSRRIDFELGGTNAEWRFTDWTGTQHKSYRLRIERDARAKALTGRATVKLTVRASTPAALARAMRDAEAFRRARRRRRLEEAGFIQHKPLRLGPVRSSAAEAPQYGKFELTFEVEGSFTNPFDPDQIDVAAEIATPSGRRVRQPAFFYQEFVRSKNGSPKPVGKPVWKVRFCPTEPGRYAYRIIAKNGASRAAGGSGEFTCAASKRRGFIRVSRSNPAYCEFETGAPFFPSGINLFTPALLGRSYPADRLPRCERWMNKLADAGGNFVRLRMDSWWLAVEMTPDESLGYVGLGYYHQLTCWIVDQLYDLAARRGLYIMHCLYNANANVNLRGASPGKGRLGWRGRYDVFLKSNGGVCAAHEDSWTNAEAKRYTRNKLRYCAARWGWSPHLMCWEFHNEVSCQPDTIDAAVAWCREMGRYLRGVDVNAHPMTTSLMGRHDLAHRIWSLPEIEIIQYHFYSSDEMPAPIAALTREGRGSHGKPFFLGEYGVKPAFRPSHCEYDRIGVHMHNGMWAAMFAGGCGAGAMWYVSDYLDAYDLWFHYRGLERFARRVPWNRKDLVPCQVERPRPAAPAQSRRYIDVAIPTSPKFAMARPPQEDFVVLRDGSVEPGDMLPPNLNVSKARKARPTFHLNLERPGRFVVRVRMSVGDETNRLLISLDGRRVVDKPFPAHRTPDGKSEFVERYDNWRTPYDEEVCVVVPAGRHIVQCEAVGKDRLEVNYILRDIVAVENSHPLRAWGFRVGRQAYLWFQNKTGGWWYAWRGQKPIPVDGMITTVHGLPDGEYRVEWFDTWKGEVFKTERAESRMGALRLRIPCIRRDAACLVSGR